MAADPGLGAESALAQQPVPLRRPQAAWLLCVRVNDEEASGQLRAGFFGISRTWRGGDTISLRLPMEPRIVSSHESLTANAGAHGS